ncbi:hypothetical protein ACHQM5_001913 [Ranunculus cassubicifolius]
MPTHRLPRLSFLLLVLFILEVSATGGRKIGGLVGSWTPIKDISDPHIQELGQFAVSEHNKADGTNLRFDRVTKGESQVVSGENYRLVVKAVDGSAANNYEAVVWEKAWAGVKNLTSFKQV